MRRRMAAGAIGLGRMSFFRSAALRRIIYALVLGLALTRLATRSHSEPLPPDNWPSVAMAKLPMHLA